jgi:transposase
VLGAFLAILWSFQRLFIKTLSGRKRLNILGALNAVTHEMITVINESYINAWSVVELMRKIRAGNPAGRVVLVLDNARYQAYYVVRAAAQMIHTGLLYLPPYSPNLNLIERICKTTHQRKLGLSDQIEVKIEDVSQPLPYSACFRLHLCSTGSTLSA